MRKVPVMLVLVVGLPGAGCLGNSSANAPAPRAHARSASPVLSGGHRPVLDAATRHRLLVEWHVAVRTAQVLYGPTGGIGFLPPRQLASAMRRAHPSIPATASFGTNDTLVPRVVFVLSPTALRLDIATVAADGRYVHLTAVGRHRRHFEFAPL
jgi:hypothetical protein